MTAITATQKGQTASGRRIMDVFILADEKPDTMPTSGAEVEGLKEDDAFAPMSIIFVPTSGEVFFANESGQFPDG